MNVEFFENPHAFNFYKLEITTESDISVLKTLKNNAVVSIKCKDILTTKIREAVSKLSNIVESRIIIIKDSADIAAENFDASTLYIDQCTKFAECCRAKLDNNDILEHELAEILK
jgi:hypothetical protein